MNQVHGGQIYQDAHVRGVVIYAHAQHTLGIGKVAFLKTNHAQTPVGVGVFGVEQPRQIEAIASRVEFIVAEVFPGAVGKKRAGFLSIFKILVAVVQKNNLAFNLLARFGGFAE